MKSFYAGILIILLSGCATPVIQKHDDVFRITYYNAFKDINDAKIEAAKQCPDGSPKLLHFSNGIMEYNEYTFRCDPRN
jgi:hypothetical protein